MKWQKHRRVDRHNLLEYICECGTGHPAYGSALWIAEAIRGVSSAEIDSEVSTQMVHGCCGCCSRDDFPGTLKDSLKHAHTIIRDLNDRVGFLLERIAWNPLEDPPEEGSDVFLLHINSEFDPGETGTARISHVTSFRNDATMGFFWTHWMLPCLPEIEEMVS